VKRCEALEEARRRAQRLHKRFGVIAPEHVRITAFAERLGASVLEARMEGANAQLVRRGLHTQIVVARHVTDLGVRRFCLAVREQP
jgi:hypothetical protein